jgi:SAM-dependent methyltransferase
VNPILARYLDWLKGHGVKFEVAADLVRDADHDGPLVEGDEEMRPVELPLIAPFVEHRDPEAGLAADHATFSLGRALLPRIEPGTRFWDIGCGTGVLAVAAGLKGASAIVATDVDERAIALARRTAADANVAIRFSHGVLLEAVPARLDADLVAANLPHKPCPPGGDLPLSQRACEDGADVHAAFAAQAAARLAPGATVGFWLHSLPDPRLFKAYAAFDLTLVSWKRRFLQPGEYAQVLPWFLDRARKGSSYIAEESGRRFLVGGVWLARRR